MFDLTIYRGRTKDFSGTLLDADGVGITLADADIVRFKLGRGLSTPILDLDDVATDSGSVVTVTQRTAAAAYSLRLAQADTATLAPGDYDAEFIVVDTSEEAPENAAKHVEYGVVHVLPTMAGDVGL